MLTGAGAVSDARELPLSLVFGDKGVTTDKPFVLEAFVRDKVPVCSVLDGR
jgi:hypothetical protein